MQDATIFFSKSPVAKKMISCKEQLWPPTFDYRQHEKHGWSNPGLIRQTHTCNLSVKGKLRISSGSWGKSHSFEGEWCVPIPKAPLPSGSFPSRNVLFEPLWEVKWAAKCLEWFQNSVFIWSEKCFPLQAFHAPYNLRQKLPFLETFLCSERTKLGASVLQRLFYM